MTSDRADRFLPGADVQSPFGKGVVRDVRNNGRVLVEVQGRTILMEARALTPLTAPPRSRRRPPAREADAPADGVGTFGAAPPGFSGPAARGVREVDLHGLTVEEALVRVEHVLDGALRDDVAELRVIHGRSGGRLRGALHRHLAAITSVRAFALDPRNEGVTVVRL